jgi:molybdopterin-guanine dinucleotide biosynthesis protein A
MGSDKALLPFGENNLLQLALDKAKVVSPEPMIVGARERYARYGQVIEDRYPECGPLGGIHAALCTTRSERNLVLSVDMPLMTAAFLLWLAQIAQSATELAVVPEVQKRLQPLCAVYHRSALDVIEQALKRRDFKVGRIYSLVPTRYVREEELLAAGFGPDIFCNINTQAEYEAASEFREFKGSVQ